MPVVSSQQPTWMLGLLQKIVGSFSNVPLAALIGAGSIKLFTAGPVPITPNAVTADFTECTFGGYAAVTVSLGAAVTLPSTEGIGRICPASFVATDALTPENVLGYYVEDSGGVLVLAEYFDAPIPMAAAGDFIDLQLFTSAAFAVATGA